MTKLQSSAAYWNTNVTKCKRENWTNREIKREKQDKRGKANSESKFKTLRKYYSGMAYNYDVILCSLHDKPYILTSQ